MKNCKKWGMLLLATLLSVAMLAGCSSDSSEATATKTLSEMYDIVCEANPIANSRELDDISIELDFMLSLDDIVDYKGIASNDGGDAGMVIVIEVAEGSADTVFAALETYADNQVLFWNNYEEFADAAASVEDSRISREGNFIIQVFAANGADYADIETALTEALG